MPRPVQAIVGISSEPFLLAVFKARDSHTVEMFLEMEGLVTECNGVLLLHECIKNIPDVRFEDKRDCSYTILDKLSHQVSNDFRV